MRTAKKSRFFRLAEKNFDKEKTERMAKKKGEKKREVKGESTNVTNSRHDYFA